jgi:hypothetical protein
MIIAMDVTLASAGKDVAGIAIIYIEVVCTLSGVPTGLRYPISTSPWSTAARNLNVAAYTVAINAAYAFAIEI